MDCCVFLGPEIHLFEPTAAVNFGSSESEWGLLGVATDGLFPIS